VYRDHELEVLERLLRNARIARDAGDVHHAVDLPAGLARALADRGHRAIVAAVHDDETGLGQQLAGAIGLVPGRRSFFHPTPTEDGDDFAFIHGHSMILCP